MCMMRMCNKKQFIYPLLACWCCCCVIGGVLWVDGVENDLACPGSEGRLWYDMWSDDLTAETYGCGVGKCLPLLRREGRGDSVLIDIDLKEVRVGGGQSLAEGFNEDGGAVAMASTLPRLHPFVKGRFDHGMQSIHI